MGEEPLYARPRVVTDLNDCLFYHTMDIQGREPIQGTWDLRAGIERYLGGVEFAGKRVLDVGAASGFLSFHMERRGAEVVSYDLSHAHAWDLVPYAGDDLIQRDGQARDNIRRINNAYWYCHQAYGSKNRVVHGTAYTIPAQIGPVDIGVFGSILEHLRDPFLALQMGARLVQDTLIVAEMLPRRRFWHRFVPFLWAPEMQLLPDARDRKHDAVWWVMQPRLIQRFLGILGFEDTRLTYHSQKFEGSTRLVYTVVGRRTKPAPVIAGQEMPRLQPKQALAG